MSNPDYDDTDAPDGYSQQPPKRRRGRTEQEPPQDAQRPQPYAFELAMESALEPDPETAASKPEPGLDHIDPRTDSDLDWLQPDSAPQHTATATDQHRQATEATARNAAHQTRLEIIAKLQAAGIDPATVGLSTETGTATGAEQDRTATDTETEQSGDGVTDTVTGPQPNGTLGHVGAHTDIASASRALSERLPDLDIQPSFEDAIAPLKPWQRAFIRALRQFGGVTKLACDRARVSRQTAYQTRENNALFRELWVSACEDATDMVEAATYKSAVHGDLEPVFQRGVIAGYRRRFCPKARELLLKAKRPADYDRGETLHVRGETKVTLVAPRELAAAVASVSERLFQARQQQNQLRAPVLDAVTGKPVDT